MSQAAGDTGEVSNNVSNNLATLVPSFDPSKDDLEQYTQKVVAPGQFCFSLVKTSRGDANVTGCR